MFENIIGNETVIDSLKREIVSGTFPRAVLFAGPRYSGKLSTALETARVLTCEQSGEWTCSCPACSQTKQLLHPYTVLAGSRTFSPEIAASSDTLLRIGSPASQHLFVRSIRKLTRRFDAHIFTTEESKRKIIQDRIMKIEDALDPLSPGRELPPKDTLKKELDVLTSLARELEQYISSDNIPVAQIRNIIGWSFQTAPSQKKIVIIENASAMLDASRNALLKTLEEPPGDVHFILITPRPDEIIPTIRSRVRKYRFSARTSQQTHEILERVFKEDAIEFESLREFFLAWEDISFELLKKLVTRFTVLVTSRQPVILQKELPELFGKNTPPVLCRTFLEELLMHFRSMVFDSAERDNPFLIDRIERWTKLLHRRYGEYISLNLSSDLFLERLFMDLQGAV